MTDAVQVAAYLLTASLAFVILALVTNLVVVTGRSTGQKRGAAEGARQREKQAVAVGAGKSSGVKTTLPSPRRQKTKLPTGLALYATGFTFVAAVLTGVYLGLRTSLTGYGPFANQHEFAVSFVFGILVAYLVAEYFYQIRVLSLVVLPVAAVLLVYAMNLDTSIRPLIPALQNNLLLTLHVGFAMFAYGAAVVSFGAAVLYLLYPYLKKTVRRLPPRDLFDDIGYKAAAVTFPLLTIMIALGAVWANTAWGRYWGWDPKETAALVTWLIYGAYLHARVTRGWQGTRSAVLLIVGFAAVMFAYFGNHFFGGLHSYA